MSNHEILGLPRTAKKEDIKKAYHRLSMVYHPDRPHGNADKFIQIKSAYEALMVPDTTRVHCQHTETSGTKFDRAYIDSSGDFALWMSLRNVLHIESFNMKGKQYHWNMSMSTHAVIEVMKEDLILNNYCITLKFTPMFGRSQIKHFRFDDPRTNWDKFWYKLFNIFR